MDTTNLISLAVSITVGLFIFFQLRYFVKQLKLHSFLEVIRTNRELIMLGISNPELLRELRMGSRTIYDEADFHPEKEIRTRYCQLWINQAHTAWQAHKMGLYTKDNWKAFKKDIVENIFQTEEFKKRWPKVRSYYAKDFREFVNSAISQSH